MREVFDSENNPLAAADAAAQDAVNEQAQQGSEWEPKAKPRISFNIREKFGMKVADANSAAATKRCLHKCG